jgi:RNA polymerase sigma factor (sigma-70 family)
VVILVILNKEEFVKLKKGDKQILKDMYFHYREKIFTYFVIRTFGNRFVADDLTQETFCAIIESVYSLTTPEYIDGWVFSIAKKKLAGYQRKLFRDKRYAKILKEQQETPGDIIEELHLKQKALLLASARENLPSFYKKVYTMKYGEGKKRKEIADTLKKSEKAIEGIITRIRKKLKKDMMRMAGNYF